MISSNITINTGCPQGCVLSASLFIIYTSDKVAEHPNCQIFKYADDTVSVGMLNDTSSSLNMYTSEVNSFVNWCNLNHLNLNVKKTKEMIVDFRKKKTEIHPIIINNENVEIVTKYKYLGCIIDDKLNWSENASNVYKKANQRLYFVRKLKKMNINKELLTMFYTTTVESILSFCITCWFGCLTEADKKKLNRIVKTA